MIKLLKENLIAVVPIVLLGLALIPMLIWSENTVIVSITTSALPVISLCATILGVQFSYNAMNEANSAKQASKKARKATENIYRSINIHQNLVPRLDQLCSDVKNVVEQANMQDKDNVQRLLVSVRLNISEISAQAKANGKSSLGRELDEVGSALSQDIDFESAMTVYKQLVTTQQRVKHDLNLAGDEQSSQIGRGQ